MSIAFQKYKEFVVEILSPFVDELTNIKDKVEQGAQLNSDEKESVTILRNLVSEFYRKKSKTSSFHYVSDNDNDIEDVYPGIPLDEEYDRLEDMMPVIINASSSDDDSDQNGNGLIVRDKNYEDPTLPADKRVVVPIDSVQRNWIINYVPEESTDNRSIEEILLEEDQIKENQAPGEPDLCAVHDNKEEQKN